MKIFLTAELLLFLRVFPILYLSKLFKYGYMYKYGI